MSDTLTCLYAFLATHPEHRQQIVDDPSIIPAAVEELLRWESPVPLGVPRIATCDGRAAERRATSPRAPRCSSSYGAANIDPPTFADPIDVRFDRERQPATSRSAAACTAASARTSPGASCGSRLREWHRRIPEYRIKPGHEELEYPPGLRHVKDLTLTWK